MKKISFAILTGLLVVASLLLATAEEEPADMLLFNGKIFTSDAAHPYVAALAIRGERIIAAGDSTTIKALAGPKTKRIDLAGHTVIPGINDAHNHLEIHPPDEIHIELKSIDPSWNAVKTAIIAAAAKAARNAPISVTIGQTIFHDTSVNRDSLDKLSTEHPIMLETFTGHGLILNTAGLRLYGISDHQPDPLGGRFERDSVGRLTGVVREYAILNVSRALSNRISDADATRELRERLTEAEKYGITTIQDMSNAMAPARAVAIFEAIPTEIRIRVMRMPGTTPAARDIQEGQGVPRHPSPLITVSGTKWMLDGVPIEGTFSPRDAYKIPATPPYDESFRNLPLTFPEKEMSAMLRESLQNDDQLLVHVAAYAAAKDMLDAMDAAGGRKVWATRRLRFEHGDGLLPDLVPRVKELGVVVVQNPSHLAALAASTAVFNESQPLKSLLAAGIPVALGSDGPVNPYLNIMVASLHPDRPSEAITREQAVVAYTLTSAYAEFAEKEKGSLEPGKLADLAVLSQDIFSVPTPALPGTVSILTMVGGKIVYDAGTVRP